MRRKESYAWKIEGGGLIREKVNSRKLWVEEGRFEDWMGEGWKRIYKTGKTYYRWIEKSVGKYRLEGITAWEFLLEYLRRWMVESGLESQRYGRFGEVGGWKGKLGMC